MKRTLSILGSLYFALALIATSAFLVMIGTVIESKSGSHEEAAGWVYGNLFFQLLLALYFVNILAAALKRYPFKRRHIPFLMTHLGLLLIILGLFSKSLFGIQGHLLLKEGSGSHTVFLPSQKTLYAIDRRGRFEELPFTFVPHVEVTYTSEEGLPLTGKNLVLYDGGFGGIFELVSPPLTEEWENALFWTYELLARLDEEIAHGRPVSELQKEKPWKFFPPSQDREQLRAFIRNELFLGRKELPKAPPYTVSEAHQELLNVEVPLQRVVTAVEDASKPPAALYQGLMIPYHADGRGLKWKMPGQEKLLSFGPKRVAIPYHVRLREATKTLFPGTNQPAHYSAKVIVYDRRTGEEKEAEIAMNRVFETKEGHRFYLSSIYEEAGRAREALLIVNHDPTKWIFTYPGGVLTIVGALLLLRLRNQKDCTGL